MTKKLPQSERAVRKPIQRACTFCHSKHLQCDSTRPCKNCTKRGVADQCEDVVRKRVKYVRKSKADKTATPQDASVREDTPGDVSSSSASLATPQPKQPLLQVLQPQPQLQPSVGSLSSTSLIPGRVQSDSVEPKEPVFADLPTTFTPPQQPLSQKQLHRSQRNHHQTMSSSSSHSHAHSHTHTHNNHSHSQRITNTVDSPDVFSSLFANQEYAQLTDLLDDSAKSPSQSSVIYNTEFQTAFQTDNNTRPYISLSDNSTSMNTNTNTVPNLMLTAQAPDYTSPLILRHLIKVPEDVYTSNLQPYNYPKAYHALLDYLRKRFNKEQLMQIAETMAAYRPSFIAATRSLVEMDLLFAERSFQRSLLEYESMSSLSSSPTIMWRRTGEVVAVSTEFSSLTSHTKTELLSKRTFIIELMNDPSALDYFRLFSSVAFGDLNGVIITECTLMSPNGEHIRCASTWTVKRDVFDIPMLIVGQFLPILQVK